MKQFNLEEAKQGKPVCTRDGGRARIICFDRKSDTYPIVALIDGRSCERMYTYTNKGECDVNGSRDFDLFMAPVKRKGWVNVYKKDINTNVTDRSGGYIHPTKEEAIKTVVGRSGYITTTEIEWEE